MFAVDFYIVIEIGYNVVAKEIGYGKSKLRSKLLFDKSNATKTNEYKFPI